jgi:REP element-mobilizing transposase RayT
MPRRSGLESAEVFHVYNRGADRQDIFASDTDQRFFELLLATMVSEMGVVLHAYALMTNHYHLILQAVGNQLSRAMYFLGKGYAVYFNDTAERSGPLCDSRFKAVPITDSDMLSIEGRYVHRNPLDLVGSAALEAYRFSSLPAYCGSQVTPEWLTTSMILDPFGGDSVAYLDFVKRPHSSDAQYRGIRPPHRPATLERLLVAIAECAGVETATLHRADRGRSNDARALAISMAVELRLGSADELADRLDFASPQAVRNAASRGRRRLARDQLFESFRNRVLNRLATEEGYVAPGAT